jgi:hypothetical protein
MVRTNLSQVRSQAHILHGLPDADRYRFHPLLAYGELAGGESVDLRRTPTSQPKPHQPLTSFGIT